MKAKQRQEVLNDKISLDIAEAYVDLLLDASKGDKQP